MKNLSDINVVKDVMGRHGFTFSKALGQNFIINPAVCPRIAEEGGARAGVGALEIGAGVGVLTAELAKRADKVVCIELDTRLLPVLDETLADFDNVTIINEDVLKADLDKIVKEQFGDMPFVVCANLPYYITSPIVMSLLSMKLPVKSLTVMVQKEAAERICAEVGSRAAGAVTAAVCYYSEPQVLFNVDRTCFLPSPKVDSAVIKLNLSEKPPVDVKDEEFFFKVIKACFAQRRKTLLNTVSNTMNIEKEKIKAVLNKMELDESIRGETLNLEQLARLSNELLK